MSDTAWRPQPVFGASGALSLNKIPLIAFVAIITAKTRKESQERFLSFKRLTYGMIRLRRNWSNKVQNISSVTIQSGNPARRNLIVRRNHGAPNGQRELDKPGTANRKLRTVNRCLHPAGLEPATL